MMYPWNRQKIRQPKNGVTAECNFSQLSKPLPPPPPGMMWIQDSKKEWSLVSMTTATAEPLPADNLATVDNTPSAAASGDDDALCAVPVSVQSATPIILSDKSKKNITRTGVLYHDVGETDTFQGICLRYKVTPMELRRANKMLGNNLKLAPSKLVIPTTDDDTCQKRRIMEPTKEEKIVALVKEVSQVAKLTYSEARAYLELADWDLGCAIGNAKEGF